MMSSHVYQENKSPSYFHFSRRGTNKDEVKSEIARKKDCIVRGFAIQMGDNLF